MVRVIEQSALYENSELAAQAIHPSLWTAIIPAAGRGSRLGHVLPKALFEVGKKPLVQWVMEKIVSEVSQIVLVISPSEKTHFEKFIEGLSYREKITLCFQTEPKGTVDAISGTEPFVKTRHSLVIWGDHFSVHPETLRWVMKAHEVRPFARLTFATCLREAPYIHVLRGEHGKIVRVLQARDETLPRFGENDCGSFAFFTTALFDISRGALRATAARLKQSELNLLTLFPLFEGDEGEVQTLRIAKVEETLGLNTKAEALVAEEMVEEKKWIAPESR